MTPTKKLIIAIDGPAASGKSTTAKILAKNLGYIYFDTGAMYRAVTLAASKNGVDFLDQNKVVDIAKSIHIELKIINSSQHTFMNGEDVSKMIRTPHIDQNVTHIATNSGVRKIMVKLQRNLAQQGGVVMDGRDIGTVVLPNADLKVFMVATIDARAKRRMGEQSNHKITLEEIKQDISRRDNADMTRKDSPLKKADDAIELDTSDLSIDQQVEKIMQLINGLKNEG